MENKLLEILKQKRIRATTKMGYGNDGFSGQKSEFDKSRVVDV